MNLALLTMTGSLLGLVHVVGALLRIKTRYVFLSSFALVVLFVGVGTYRGRAGRTDFGTIVTSYGPTFGMPHTSGAIYREDMKWIIATVLVIEVAILSYLYRTRRIRRANRSFAPRAILGILLRRRYIVWVTVVLFLSVCYAYVFVFDQITRLHRAAASGDLDTIRRLVTDKPELLESNHFRSTPLCRAVTKGQALAALLLLEKGADVNVYCTTRNLRHTSSLLQLAASLGHFGIARDLLEHGAPMSFGSPINYTQLYWAAEQNSLEYAKLLLEFGADVNAKCGSNSDSARSPVSRAKSHDMVALLIDHGARLGAGDHSALTNATFRGNLDSVHLLVRVGANVNGKNHEGLTPLHYAAQRGHVEIARFLLSHGANPDVTGGRADATPLHYAAGYGHVELAAVLLGAGCTINAYDIGGHTPMYWAYPQRSRANRAQAQKTYNYLRIEGGVTDTRVKTE